MVVFACNACGSSLKKNQVEKHYTFQCKKCTSVSCMDCNKDFWGEDFKTHVKCISENEKYGGQNYVPKASANKGEKKQEAWIEHVNKVIAEKGSKIDHRLRTLLESIVNYPNIPRKKPKFENFVKNSLFCRDPGLISKAWDIFASSKEEMNGKPAQNGTKKQEEKADVAVENTEATSNGQEENEKKLSKREKKELRKQAQTKVEKKSKKRALESDDTQEADECMDTTEESEEPQKKKKKKLQQSEEVADTEEAAEEVETEVRKKKKKKKQKVEEDNQMEVEQPEEEAEGKKKKKKKAEDLETSEVVDPEETEADQLNETGPAEETEPLPKLGKFKWESVMSEILSSAPDKELPIKRLKKKVLAEYESRPGGKKGKSQNSHEFASAKFEAKLKNRHLFRVLKDRVKLLGE